MQKQCIKRYAGKDLQVSANSAVDYGFVLFFGLFLAYLIHIKNRAPIGSPIAVHLGSVKVMLPILCIVAIAAEQAYLIKSHEEGRLYGEGHDRMSAIYSERHVSPPVSIGH